jgi:hypothetical protein
MVPAASTSPVSIFTPVSSVKKADRPPPSSSVPRKPMREAEAAPLVSLVDGLATPPRSLTMAASTMP